MPSPPKFIVASNGSSKNKSFLSIPKSFKAWKNKKKHNIKNKNKNKNIENKIAAHVNCNNFNKKRFRIWFPSPDSCLPLFNYAGGGGDDDGDGDGDGVDYSFSSLNFDYSTNSYLKNKPVNWKGHYLDAVHLLSNNGRTTNLVRCNGDVVGLDVLRGKHLIICCFRVPFLAGSNVSGYCPSMIDAYSELKLRGFEVEMVLVAKMKSGFLEDKASFDHFFSAFPCLAIPFSQAETRHHICSFIGSDPVIASIVLDPTGLVLHHNNVYHHFHDYGSDGFPFLERDLEAIETQDEVMRIRLDPFYNINLETLPKAVMKDPLLRKPLSLYEDILQYPPNCILPRFRDAGGLTVSQLSEKYVGLYLWVDGEFMEELDMAHKHCISNDQELEIVLVSVSLFNVRKVSEEYLKSALKHFNITSWFILDDSQACHRLWRVFGQRWEVDKLIILPPNCESGELEGRAVITQLGVEEYPFTRRSIFERRFTTLRSLTPASWFNGTVTGRTCLYCNGRKTNVRWSEIDSTKLLLFLDWLDFSDDKGKLCRLLMKHYTKVKDNGWEVVFVPLDDVECEVQSAIFSDMPWPIMPVSDAVKYSVVPKLFFQGEAYHNRLILLGRNRRVLSREAGKKNGFWKSLNNTNLHEELFTPLALLEVPE